MEIEVKRVKLDKFTYALAVYIDGERVSCVTNVTWEINGGLPLPPTVTLTLKPDSLIVSDEFSGETYKYGKE